MAQSDAYGATSGGWSGGQQAMTGGGVLGSYMMKMKQVDPSSGSLVNQAPSQPNQQASSIAQVASTSTPQVPTMSRTIAQSGVLAPVAQTPTVQQPGSTSGGLWTSIDPNAAAKAAGAQTPAVQASYAGPSVVYAQSQGSNGHTYRHYARIDPTTGGYVDAGTYDMDANTFTTPTGTVTPGGWQIVKNLTGNIRGDAPYLGGLNLQEGGGSTPGSNLHANSWSGSIVGLANHDYAQQLAAYVAAQKGNQATADATNQAALQHFDDQQTAAVAQAQADRATAFSLGSGLIAPNTDATDQAGTNALNSVVSRYSSGLGGIDSGAYQYAGQQAQATQGAVNQVQHDQAYATSFNNNYQLFQSALQRQQASDANASYQKLQLDVQGISDAVASLQQQATQLNQTHQTALQGALNPLQDLINKYNTAVRNQGADSDAAVSAAQSLLSLGGSLTAAAV